MRYRCDSSDPGQLTLDHKKEEYPKLKINEEQCPPRNPNHPNQQM